MNYHFRNTDYASLLSTCLTSISYEQFGPDDEYRRIFYAEIGDTAEAAESDISRRRGIAPMSRLVVRDDHRREPAMPGADPERGIREPWSPETLVMKYRFVERNEFVTDGFVHTEKARASLAARAIDALSSAAMEALVVDAGDKIRTQNLRSIERDENIWLLQITIDLGYGATAATVSDWHDRVLSLVAFHGLRAPVLTTA